MIKSGVCKMRGAAGILLFFAMSTASADIALSAGESCASASCHAGFLHSTGPHDGEADQELCNACHVPDVPEIHEFKYAESGGQLCIDCHASLMQHDFKHEPAEQGLCSFCHSAHESEYAEVLKVPPEAFFDKGHTSGVQKRTKDVHRTVEKGHGFT